MSLREPLVFAPRPFDRVWGGNRLARFAGAAEPLAVPLGEVWTLADRDGATSTVRGGRHDGKSLRELVRSERDALLGRARGDDAGGFPLLVKLIDTSQDLSVQVHPGDAAARALGNGAQGKTECWYVLAAEPGARIHLGLADGVDAARCASAAGSRAIVELLRSWTVEAGDFVLVPPGTVHSIGAGLTLVEIQDNSDTTYRLYDWDRPGLDGKPRPIHLEAALRAIDHERVLAGPFAPRARERSPGVREAVLVECAAFRVELLELARSAERTTAGRPLVYVVVSGRGRLVARGAWPLESWQTVLVPADVEAHTIEPVGGEPLRLLCAAPGAETSA